jgi:hypothetical protein
MTMRYCPRCASEVEDVGGFCLLGHPLRLEPLIPSVSHIRAEVDRAFDEVDTAVDRRTPAAEPALGGSLSAALLPEASLRRDLEQAGPTPPPPPAPHRALWESLEEGLADLSDPIATFAPSPRMDWGPERPRLLDQLPLRRRGAATA